MEVKPRKLKSSWSKETLESLIDYSKSKYWPIQAPMDFSEELVYLAYEELKTQIDKEFLKKIKNLK